jgi:hypothetical protein
MCTPSRVSSCGFFLPTSKLLLLRMFVFWISYNRGCCLIKHLLHLPRVMMCRWQRFWWVGIWGRGWAAYPSFPLSEGVIRWNQSRPQWFWAESILSSVLLKNWSVVVFLECHVGILRQNHEVGSSIRLRVRERALHLLKWFRTCFTPKLLSTRLVLPRTMPL